MLEFDDSAWTPGSGEFGYSKKSDDAPERTVIKKAASAFFRLSFEVDDATRYSDLTGHLLRDDGAAVYLNGVEVERQRLMAGAAPTAWADSKTFERFHEESVYFPFRIDSDLLRNGRNVVAVEVHQHAANSNDFGFDFAMTAGPLGLLADAGGQARVRLVKEPGHGRLELNPDGSLFYAPEDSYCGMDRFTCSVLIDGCESNAVTCDLRIHDDAEVSVVWKPETRPLQRESLPARLGMLRFSRTGNALAELEVRYSAQHHPGSSPISDYQTDRPDRSRWRDDSDEYSALNGMVRIPAGSQHVELPVLLPHRKPHDDHGNSVAIQLLRSPFYRVSQDGAVAEISESR